MIAHRFILYVLPAILLFLVIAVFATPIDDTKTSENEADEKFEEVAPVALQKKKCKDYPTIPSEIPLTFESVRF